MAQHQLTEPVEDFLREFGAYLWETREWSASCGPVVAIREATADGEAAWAMFWKLVDELRERVGSNAHARRNGKKA